MAAGGREAPYIQRSLPRTTGRVCDPPSVRRDCSVRADFFGRQQGLGMTGFRIIVLAYSRSRKANWLGKKNLESRVRGIFQRDDAPGIGAVQMTSERVARGAGPVQLLVGAHRGANRKRHFSATPTTRQHVHGRRFYGAIPAPS